MTKKRYCKKCSSENVHPKGDFCVDCAHDNMQKVAGEITNLLSDDHSGDDPKKKNWMLMKLFATYRESVKEWGRAHGITGLDH